LTHQLPQREPDLKIGPFQLWVSGFNDINQKGQGDFAYLSTPSLLVTKDIIVFSANSDTPVFTFKQFLNDLLKLYENIADKHLVEFASDDSEFRLSLTNNESGQIKISINYNSWSDDRCLEFDEIIDQSYLPKIITDLKIILTKQY
ncbi:MAG: hypothetical protein M3N14_06885, partial [Bacteroidota bacterium]|nr:hypothetical protein [Bacteroidota bacterium]